MSAIKNPYLDGSIRLPPNVGVAGASVSSGDDVQVRLPLLSTYLGHVHPGST